MRLVIVRKCRRIDSKDTNSRVRTKHIARIERVDGMDGMGRDVGIETQRPTAMSQRPRRSATRHSNAINPFERRYILWLCSEIRTP